MFFVGSLSYHLQLKKLTQLRLSKTSFTEAVKSSLMFFGNEMAIMLFYEGLCGRKNTSSVVNHLATSHQCSPGVVLTA